MGLLIESGPPSWHPASPELKVLFLNFNFVCFFVSGYILLTNTMFVCVCADVCQHVMPKRNEKVPQANKYCGRRDRHFLERNKGRD